MLAMHYLFCFYFEEFRFYYVQAWISDCLIRFSSFALLSLHSQEPRLFLLLCQSRTGSYLLVELIFCPVRKGQWKELLHDNSLLVPLLSYESLRDRTLSPKPFRVLNYDEFHEEVAMHSLTRSYYLCSIIGALMLTKTCYDHLYCLLSLYSLIHWVSYDLQWSILA